MWFNEWGSSVKIGFSKFAKIKQKFNNNNKTNTNTKLQQFVYGTFIKCCFLNVFLILFNFIFPFEFWFWYCFLSVISFLYLFSCSFIKTSKFQYFCGFILNVLFSIALYWCCCIFQIVNSVFHLSIALFVVDVARVFSVHKITYTLFYHRIIHTHIYIHKNTYTNIYTRITSAQNSKSIWRKNIEID